MQLTHNNDLRIAAHKAQLGVTLIELLVVIVLLGIAIALVGPFTINQVDSAKARNEQLMLQRWLQKQSYNAFTTDSPILLKFDGKLVYRHLFAGTPIYNQQMNIDSLIGTTDKSTDFGGGFHPITDINKSSYNDLNAYLTNEQTNAQAENAETKPAIVFSYLFFKPQSLLINRHGYINQTSFNYYYKGNETSLNIAELLTGALHD